MLSLTVILESLSSIFSNIVVYPSLGRFCQGSSKYLDKKCNRIKDTNFPPKSPIIIVLPVGQPGEHLGIQLGRVLVPLLLGVWFDQHLVQLLAYSGYRHFLAILRLFIFNKFIMA